MTGDITDSRGTGVRKKAEEVQISLGQKQVTSRKP